MPMINYKVVAFLNDGEKQFIHVVLARLFVGLKLDYMIDYLKIGNRSRMGPAF